MYERDIAKDRDLARLALEAHKEDVIPDETHDFSATVVGLASMALHYISRTEHLERMLEAAIDEIARRAEEVDAFKGPCPNGGWGCAKLGDLRESKNFNTTDEDEHEFCRKCWSDYLEQKAAAIEVKRRWLKGEATDEELEARTV